MMLRHYLSNLSPAETLGLALLVVIMVFGVLGTVYETWRK
jgi:hypothetical protein